LQLHLLRFLLLPNTARLNEASALLCLTVSLRGDRSDAECYLAAKDELELRGFPVDPLYMILAIEVKGKMTMESAFLICSYLAVGAKLGAVEVMGKLAETRAPLKFWEFMVGGHMTAEAAGVFLLGGDVPEELRHDVDLAEWIRRIGREWDIEPGRVSVEELRG
jgi:hypothetical protein